nr:agmatinase [Desulfobulbaceae bacterium]
MTTITNFHGDDVAPSPPEEALFHVIPVPYEKTTSYGQGTSLGPQAILDASCQLELFDGKNIPASFGLYTAPSVNCSGSETKIMERIAARVGDCVAHGKIPVVVGGEHTVTLGSILGLEHRYASYGVVHFDAHADLRNSYQGSQYSHACVMRRIHERNIPFFQFGTRSYCHEEHIFRKDNKIPYLDAEEIFKGGIEGFVLPPGFPDKIFITFDIDVFDPALMPATGTPVPGGLNWYQALWLIEKILDERICIGFDVVEFAPIPQLHGAAFTAAQLIYNIMGYVTRSEVNTKQYLLGVGHTF